MTMMMSTCKRTSPISNHLGFAFWKIVYRRLNLRAILEIGDWNLTVFSFCFCSLWASQFNDEYFPTKDFKLVPSEVEMTRKEDNIQISQGQWSMVNY